MFSSSNNEIGPFFSPYFPLSTSFSVNETLLGPTNPNFLQNDFPNFVEPISNGFVKNLTPSYESILPREALMKKKDMPRKINTAKGPRERRVRLSLNVAQKFFDLQDMLGFDKASKTLDWLLEKSNTAIEELQRVSSRHVNSIGDYEKSAYRTRKCEVLSDQTNEDSKASNMNSDFTRDRLFSKRSFQIIGRQSRSKARERARKRTKEKMGATRACDIMHLDTSYPIMNRIEPPNYSETTMVNYSTNEQDACFKVSQAQRTCTIDNSNLINKNLMNPYSVLNSSSSSINNQNWENIGALVPRPLFYVENAPLETEFQDC